MANEGALLKRVYGQLSDPIAPEGSLAEFIPFNTRDKIGENYIVPIRLGLELGYTLNADHTAFALNAPREGRYEDATIAGMELINRAQMSYGMMARLSDAKGDSRKAYDQDLAVKIANMVQGAELIREISILYGAGAGTVIADDIGVVAGVGTVSTGTLNISITAASLIYGLWFDALGIPLDVYSSDGGTKINTNAPVVVTQVGNIDNGIIQISGNATDLAAVAAGMRLQLVGALSKSMLGVSGILKGPASLYGIPTAAYPQLKGINYNVNGALAFEDVAVVLGKVADRGAKKGGTLFVTNQQWASLLNDEAALRYHFGEKAITEINVGAKKLVFHAQIGPVVVQGYRNLKQSEAFFLSADDWERIGAQDLDQTVPGNKDEWFYLQLPSNAGAEIRTYGDQAVFGRMPFHSARFYGITVTGSVTPGAPV